MLHSLKYTTDVPGGKAGAARYWMIYIHPDYKGDEGLFQHELLHVEQFWVATGITLLFIGGFSLAFEEWIPLPLMLLSPFVHAILNKFIRPYRRLIETAAYRKQLEYPPATKDVGYYRIFYAHYLSALYDLNITYEEAYELLE